MENKIQITFNDSNKLAITTTNTKNLHNGVTKTVQTSNNNVENNEVFNSLHSVMKSYNLNTPVSFELVNTNNNIELWQVQKSEMFGFGSNVQNENIMKNKLEINPNNKSQVFELYTKISSMFSNTDNLGYGDISKVKTHWDDSAKFMSQYVNSADLNIMEKDVNIFLNDLFE